MNSVIWTVLAQGAPAADGGGGQPGGCGAGGFQPFIIMLLMFVVFWFILIRPQQKKAKEHAAMLNALQKGDTVITRGGIIGKISGVQDNIVTLELQEKVRVRILKSYIEGKQTEKTTTEAKPEAKADKKSDKKSEATAE